MNNRFLHSPVSDQTFIWIASYQNNTFLSEYSYDSQTENSFQSIDRESLIRFGLIGYGMNMYYEVYGGVFKIAGQMVEVFLREKNSNKEYYLTGQQLMYNDIIQYKNAESIFNPSGQEGQMESNITQYNFGYKNSMLIDDLNVNFRAICCVPYGDSVYLNFRIVTDRDFEGVYCIKRNGEITSEIDTKLEANVASEMNWQVNA